KQSLEASPRADHSIPYVTSKEDDAYDLMTDVVDHYEERLTKEIKETMGELYQQWKRRVQFIHKVGQTSTTICHTAKEDNADLIVVGSHGRGFVDRALLGSVAHAVLNRSEIPVLVAR